MRIWFEPSRPEQWIVFQSKSTRSEGKEIARLTFADSCYRLFGLARPLDTLNGLRFDKVPEGDFFGLQAGPILRRAQRQSCL